MWWMTSALATTWNLPADYATLQEAFDDPAVATGDILELDAGAFAGAVLDNGKTLDVRGVGPSTVIQQTGSGAVLIYVSGSTLDLSDLTIDGQGNNAGLFADNLATVNVDSVAFVNGRDRSDPDPPGGACFMVSNASGVIDASSFTGCEGLSGAGGALRTRVSGSVTVRATTFDGNTSLGSGGAIKSDAGSSITFEDVTVTNNSAFNGGAMSIDGNFDMLGGLFEGNDAGGSGGAIHTAQASAAVTVDDVTFQNNTAVADGGAVSGLAITTLTRTWLLGNNATNGGAISTDGQLFIRNAYACGNIATAQGHVIDGEDGDVDVSNFLSVENGDGSGLAHTFAGFVHHSTFIDEDASPIVRVGAGTFADNIITSTATPEPPGLSVVGTTPTVDNNLVWGATIVAGFDTMPLTDDPGVVQTGVDCSDLWTTYATNVIDRSALFLLDPDGSTADLGHLGGPAVDAVWWAADLDMDGSLIHADCDDEDPLRLPSAAEVCDGIDNDCDGLVDDADNSLDAPEYYFDNDGDGFGGDGEPAVMFCNPPLGYVSRVGDCNDSDAGIYDLAVEACVDNIDNDCDGLVDSADDEFDPDPVPVYIDQDRDGVGNPAVSLQVCSSGQPIGYVAASIGDDCDDSNPLVNPLETEVCDEFDNNCDGTLNEGFITSPYYPDVDGDQFGDLAGVVLACEPIPGMVNDGTDCDDTNASINPAATEICDDIDQDCDGAADEGIPTTTWYVDDDGDGYGDANDPGTADCGTIPDTAQNDSDCDDSDATINPAAPEVPDDGIDNDCVGGDEVSPIIDTDGDGIPDDIDPNPNSDGDLTGLPPDAVAGCGCQTGGAAGWVALLALAAVRRRRS